MLCVSNVQNALHTLSHLTLTLIDGVGTTTVNPILQIKKWGTERLREGVIDICPENINIKACCSDILEVKGQRPFKLKKLGERERDNENNRTQHSYPPPSSLWKAFSEYIIHMWNQCCILGGWRKHFRECPKYSWSSVYK